MHLTICPLEQLAAQPGKCQVAPIFLRCCEWRQEKARYLASLQPSDNKGSAG